MTINTPKLDNSKEQASVDAVLAAKKAEEEQAKKDAQAALEAAKNKPKPVNVADVHPKSRIPSDWDIKSGSKDGEIVAFYRGHTYEGPAGKFADFLRE